MAEFNLGDFISLIIVFVLYLAAVSGRKNKERHRAKGSARRSPMRTRVQGEREDKRAQERDRQTHACFDEAKASCGIQQMHLHEVTQKQFSDAAEGEDPCHAGGVSALESKPFDERQDVESETLAQDILRGVVMSEILIRPHERSALRRGRR